MDKVEQIELEINQLNEDINIVQKELIDFEEKFSLMTGNRTENDKKLISDLEQKFDTIFFDIEVKDNELNVYHTEEGKEHNFAFINKIYQEVIKHFPEFEEHINVLYNDQLIKNRQLERKVLSVIKEKRSLITNYNEQLLKNKELLEQLQREALELEMKKLEERKAALDEAKKKQEEEKKRLAKEKEKAEKLLKEQELREKLEREKLAKIEAEQDQKEPIIDNIEDDQDNENNEYNEEEYKQSIIESDKPLIKEDTKPSETEEEMRQRIRAEIEAEMLEKQNQVESTLNNQLEDEELENQSVETPNDDGINNKENTDYNIAIEEPNIQEPIIKKAVKRKKVKLDGTDLTDLAHELNIEEDFLAQEVSKLGIFPNNNVITNDLADMFRSKYKKSKPNMFDQVFDDKKVEDEFKELKNSAKSEKKGFFANFFKGKEVDDESQKKANDLNNRIKNIVEEDRASIEESKKKENNIGKSYEDKLLDEVDDNFFQEKNKKESEEVVENKNTKKEPFFNKEGSAELVIKKPIINNTENFQDSADFEAKNDKLKNIEEHSDVDKQKLMDEFFQEQKDDKEDKDSFVDKIKNLNKSIKIGISVVVIMIISLLTIFSSNSKKALLKSYDKTFNNPTTLESLTHVDFMGEDTMEGVNGLNLFVTRRQDNENNENYKSMELDSEKYSFNWERFSKNDLLILKSTFDPQYITVNDIKELGFEKLEKESVVNKEIFKFLKENIKNSKLDKDKEVLGEQETGLKGFLNYYLKSNKNTVYTYKTELSKDKSTKLYNNIFNAFLTNNENFIKEEREIEKRLKHDNMIIDDVEEFAKSIFSNSEVQNSKLYFEIDRKGYLSSVRVEFEMLINEKDTITMTIDTLVKNVNGPIEVDNERFHANNINISKLAPRLIKEDFQEIDNSEDDEDKQEQQEDEDTGTLEDLEKMDNVTFDEGIEWDSEKEDAELNEEEKDKDKKEEPKKILPQEVIRDKKKKKND